MSPSQPQRVLFVRLGAIGDVVNALVTASALKAARPEVHVGWVVHDLAHPLVAGHPAVDRVHLWKRGGGWRGFTRLVRELRAERYDVAVDLQRIAKSALVARLAGAPRVVGYDRGRTKEQSWLLTRERIAPGDGGAHMVEQYLDMARHLGGVDDALRALPPAPEAEARVARRLDGIGPAPVQINLGASKPANRWEPERFGVLAGRVARELALPVVLTGAPHERELAQRALAAAGDGAGILDLVGETSLPELWSLSRRCRLFVGCDTGPMHLAAAVGTPVLALFGPATPRRTGPFGEGHRVLATHPPCAPCGKKHCEQPRHACMEDLSVELVFDAVRAACAGAATRTTTGDPQHDPSGGPANDPARGQASGPANDPAICPSRGPAAGSVSDPAGGPASDPADGPSHGPSHGSASDSAQDPARGPEPGPQRRPVR